MIGSPSVQGERRRGSLSRRGTSLIEMLVVITLGALMLSVALGWFGVLIQADREASRVMLLTTTYSRLAGQLRADAYAAPLVEFDSMGGQVQGFRLIPVSPQSPTIHYSWKEGRITRMETGAAVAIRREHYEFDRHAEITASRIQEGRLLELSLTRPAPQTQEAPVGSSNRAQSGGRRWLRILALLGGQP